jgi:hypothetical protein
LITDTGYDAQTGIFVMNGPDRFPSIHRNFDADLVREALRTCLLPFREYQFTDSVRGKTAMLCAVLTAVLRPALDKAPMIAISSRDPGAGKTQMALALGAIATGEIPDVTSLEKSSSPEMRKQLHTALLEGKQAIIYDNMDYQFRNEVLSSFVTAPVWSGRILGESRSGGNIRNTALLICNGVQMSFGQGMSRRHLLIEPQLVAKSDIFRDFGFVPQTEALQHRPAIIAAALSLITVATQAQDDVSGTLGSFELWSAFVRQPIATLARLMPELGLCDPLELFAEAIAQSSDIDPHYEILAHLEDKFGDADFEAKEVRRLFLEDADFEILMKDISASDPVMSPHSIGALLAKLRGVQALDLCLQSRKRGGKNLWRIEQVSGNGREK